MLKQEAEALKAMQDSAVRLPSITEATKQVGEGYVEHLDLRLERRLYYDSLFSIMMPNSFIDAAASTTSPMLPEVVLVSPDKAVFILIDFAKIDYAKDEVGNSLEQIRSSIKLVGPQTRIYKSGIFELDGQNVEYLEFFNAVASDDLFNAFFQTSVGGKSLYCHFYCRTEVARKWRNTFWGMD